MITTFFKFNAERGALGAWDYLNGNRARNRPTEQIFANKAVCLSAFAEIDSIYANKPKEDRVYTTSGCLSFEESHENISEDTQLEIIELFESTLLSGLYMPEGEEKAYHCDWIRHTDKSSDFSKNRLELNFHIPRYNFLSKTILSPYYHYGEKGGNNDRERVNTLKELINDVYGFSSPDDPMRAHRAAYSSSEQHTLSRKQYANYIDDYIIMNIESGLITNREDVIEALSELPEYNEAGEETGEKLLTIERTNAKTISVKIKGEKQNLRLKGAIYEQIFNATDYFERKQTAARQFHSETGTRIRRNIETLRELNDAVSEERIRKLRASKRGDPEAIERAISAIRDSHNEPLRQLQRKIESAEFKERFELRQRANLAILDTLEPSFRSRKRVPDGTTFDALGITYSREFINEVADYESQQALQSVPEQTRRTDGVTRRDDYNVTQETSTTQRRSEQRAQVVGETNNADEARHETNLDVDSKHRDNSADYEHSYIQFDEYENRRELSSRDQAADSTISELGILTGDPELSKKLAEALKSPNQPIREFAEKYNIPELDTYYIKRAKVLVNYSSKHKHIYLTDKLGQRTEFVDKGSKLELKDVQEATIELQIKQALSIAQAKGWPLDKITPSGTEEFKKAFAKAAENEIKRKNKTVIKHNDRTEHINRTTTREPARTEGRKHLSEGRSDKPNKNNRAARRKQPQYAEKLGQFISSHERRANKEQGVTEKHATALRANSVNARNRLDSTISSQEKAIETVTDFAKNGDCRFSDLIELQKSKLKKELKTDTKNNNQKVKQRNKLGL
ncbi:TPA: LPD7 domain-containing protein [Vibrio parahaemolyticus]